MNMMPYLIGGLSIVLTFGLAVFIHELGHFMFARLRGVGVEEFAIGMGPTIWSFKYGKTVYALRCLPLGGFVKLHQMVREEAEEDAKAEAEATSEDEKKSLGSMAHQDMAALYDKDLLTKLLVFGGGVFFNFLIAMVATALLFGIGFEQAKPGPAWIAPIAENSALWNAGLRGGDFLIEIQGKAVDNAESASIELSKAIETGSAKEKLLVKVRRGSETLELSLPPFTEENQETYAGAFWEFPAIVAGVTPMGPADKAGIKEDDMIVAVNDRPVESWSQMSKIVKANLNEAIAVSVKRKGEEKPLNFSLVPIENPTDPGTGMIGIASGGSLEKTWVQESVLLAAANAPKRTAVHLVRLVEAQIHGVSTIIEKSGAKGLQKALGGPIAIAVMTKKQAEKGFRESLNWFIVFNLILIFMNLLPIPVLDGGFIVLALLEAVFRRPVPISVLNPIFTVFVLGFIGLAVMVSYNDVLNAFF